MATKTLSVEERLQSLYNLQSIDSELDKIEILKGELPMEVSDLEDEIVGLNTRISKLESAYESIKDDISKYNANIKESEALIERYNSQLDNVKNNREYDALTKELELQNVEIQLAKKRIGEAEKELELKEETLKKAQEKLEKREKDLERKKEELKKIISKTEKEEKKLIKESEKARKNISDRLLKAYDKIRSTYRNGLAVVTISRGSCGGCFNAIPPQQQIDIGLMKNIIACEHCGRVIVDDSIAGEEQEEA